MSWWHKHAQLISCDEATFNAWCGVEKKSDINDHLLAKGRKVRALVRDPHAAAAQILLPAGVEIVQGDINDPASLEATMQNVYGVFSVQPHSDDEAHQGKGVADVAQAVGIQHFVYTSIGSAEELFRRRVNVGKWEIEQHIRKLGLPATILRPAGFMDSFTHPLYGVSGDTLAIPIKPDTAYPLIAVDDIGAFAAFAFDSPDDYLGRVIELVGDTPTPPQIATAITRATGRHISYVHISIETVRQQNAELARACDFINESGFKADIAALRKLHPGLMNFETWLEKKGKAQFEAINRSKHG
ncbi:hypothetical protein KSC_012490 [Ktedonobacter sp. SOSP1-52]|uniref:NmrA/HSCARG family protein n=1 Tax=Ktedonobacter sp. SOSP1-52 TaxID=2778366 RepID=UPI001A183875|nr:NmrA/HSCARG family protein [Ktedonobacter sp. SOSP1-52]GHO62357.1 hypothetical protein KSC_012490 [Ktedonobacter sp. SOSP1-52]